MRKVSWFAFVGAAALVLAAFAQPAFAAGPNITQVSGEWTWVRDPGSSMESVVGGGKTLRGSETGTWKGTFEGTAHEPFFALFRPDGTAAALLVIGFAGAVNGTMTGEMTMEVTAFIVQGEVLMRGTWRIVGGTRDLAKVHGEGSWVQTTPGVPAATYQGWLTN